MSSTVDALAWQDRAYCRTVADPDAWFAAPTERWRLAIARRGCRACPVLADCRAYALRLLPSDGIWAGLTPSQIRELRRKGNR